MGDFNRLRSELQPLASKINLHINPLDTDSIQVTRRVTRSKREIDFILSNHKLSPSKVIDQDWGTDHLPIISGF